jgi:hypothetical protein
MRRITLAALLAAPFLLAASGRAAANPPGSTGHPCLSIFGCGGTCVGLFSKIHQHGPLYNYGPYTGYYPFAPYGPWNEYMQWTGDNYGPGDCKGCKKSFHGNPHALFGGHGCGSCGACGGHSPALDLLRKKARCGDGCGTPGCSSCGGAAVAAPAPAGMGQYAGYGYPQAPAHGYPPGYGYPYAAANNYYYGPYQVTPPAPQQYPVMPAGATGR